MWGFKRLVRRKKRPPRSPRARAHYELYKETARTFIESRIAYWAPRVGVTPERIAIRDQRSRWGSCSTKRNLNFNYRLVLIPQDLADYVIVHELCHLLEFNHGERFWEHVARAIPTYTERKQALHELSRSGVLYHTVPVQKERI